MPPRFIWRRRVSCGGAAAANSVQSNCHMSYFKFSTRLPALLALKTSQDSVDCVSALVKGSENTQKKVSVNV